MCSGAGSGAAGSAGAGGAVDAGCLDPMLDRLLAVEVAGLPDSALAADLVGLRVAVSRLESEFARRLVVFDRRGAAGVTGAVSTAAVEDHQPAGELRLQPGDRDPQPHQVGGQGGVRQAGHLHREQPVQHRVQAAGVDGTAGAGTTGGTAPCARTHVLRIGRPSDRNRAVHRSPPGTLTGDVMPRLTRPCGATSTSGARAWSELARGRTCPATTRSSITRCTPWRASPRWRTALATVRKPSDRRQAPRFFVPPAAHRWYFRASTSTPSTTPPSRHSATGPEPHQRSQPAESQAVGPEVLDHLTAIFADHPTAACVAKVRTLRPLGRVAVVLRAGGRDGA